MRNSIAIAMLAAFLALCAAGCAERKIEEPTPESVLAQKASSAYKDGNFQESASAYMEAIALCEAKDPERTKSFKEKLAFVYYEWALHCAISSQKEKTVEDYEQAIGLCDSAAEFNPLLKAKCSNLVEKCQKRISVLKYRAEMSDVKLIPDGKAVKEKIEIFMKQGDSYYAAKDYGEARKRYEKVIKLDPYNADAIQAIKKMDLKIAEAGKARAENSRLEMMAEVKWAGVQPIPPRQAGEPEAKAAGPAQADVAFVEKALRDASFPFLSFEKARMQDVFAKIEAESAAAGYPVSFVFEGVDMNSPDLPLISFKTDRISLAEALNSVCKPFNLLYIPTGGSQIKVFKKPPRQTP